MKKLMIAAAVVCVAVAANAAALSWAFQTTSVQYAIPAATVKAGLEANTTYDAKTTKVKGNSSYSNVYVQIVLTSQDDSTKTDTITANAAYTTGGNWKISGLTSKIVDETDKGEKYNYAITMFADITDGKGNSFDKSYTSTVSGTWTVQSTGDAGIKIAAPTTWTTTPEPTSGLLLLLGVAGLALRRKQK